MFTKLGMNYSTLLCEMYNPIIAHFYCGRELYRVSGYLHNIAISV